jgi:Tol biopolymer transport system component
VYSDRTAPSGVQRLYRLSLETLESSELTRPDGTESEGDVWPSFSPDGRLLSFRRGSAEMIPVIHFLDLESKEVRRIPLEAAGAGRDAWMVDGSGLIVPARWGGLLTVDIESGESEFIPGVSGTVRWVSRKGTRLAYSREQGDTDIWQARLGESGTFGKPDRCIASTRLDGAPDFSPDGKRIAFGSTRSGKGQIWVFEEATGVTRQVTNVQFAGAPRWSPDGRQIAFDGITEPGARPDIFRVNWDGSNLRRLTSDPADDNLPFWSNYGTWIYFSSNRTGRWEIWKMTLEGEDPSQVTQNGGFAAQESPDGRFLYLLKSLYEPGVWRVPLDGGEETRVLDQSEAGYWGYWQIGKSGIYYSDPGSNQLVAWAGGRGCFTINFLELANGRTRPILEVEGYARPWIRGLAVAPDESRILFNKIDKVDADLMLIESFR